MMIRDDIMIRFIKYKQISSTIIIIIFLKIFE